MYCNYLFSASFSLLCSLFLFFGIPTQARMLRKNGERKEERRRPKKKALHELPYTEIVKKHCMNCRTKKL